jgi:hypothetical protein
MDLAKEIKELRPNITDSSIKTYKSVLTNLFKKCYPDDEMSLDLFNNHEHFLKHLMEEPYNKRKSKLSALVVLTGNKHYQKQMMEDKEELNKDNLNQTKNEKQEDAMIPMSEVDDIYKQYEMNAKAHLTKKQLNANDLNEIQKWILLSLTSGIFLSPRRSADWNMKWRNYDEEKDNYVDIKNKQFVFNAYKTAKIYGQSKIEIPKPLQVILNKWFKINPTDYVLFDGKEKPLTSPQITHRLNSIFNKNISTSMLRHIYLTHKFGNVNLKDLSDTASAMGTSKIEALQYVKH